jgi:hypothetical protein
VSAGKNRVMAPWIALMVLTLPVGCRTGGAVFDTGYDYLWEMDPDAEPIPFGFWGLNGYHTPEGLADVQDRFAVSVFHTSTYSQSWGVGTLLPLVRDAGLSVNLRMAGDHSYYTNAEGDFDLAAWKEMLAPWEGSGVQEYIDDGTLAHHMLLDDIDTFAGRSPDGDDLEEMARYSKSIMPGLRVAVREEAAEVPHPSAGGFESLDASINQYVSWAGDVESYALRNQEAAEALGLDIINGLNIADGGNGTSEQAGWSEGRWAMSATEIVTYGHVLSAVPGCVMFLAWEYDGEQQWPDGTVGSDYFDREDTTAALRWLALRLAGEESERPR